ncbi:MAG: AraC family transcriptional regulator [Clostridium sp.]|nr:AraC family transcriptional regulator [Clostridium sp.]
MITGKNTYAHEIINDDTRLHLHFLLIRDGRYFYSPPHWHGHLEIVFIQKGNMTAWVNEQQYHLRDNDMLVVNSRELHSTKSSENIEYLLLQIPYDYLERMINDMALVRFQEYFPAGAASPALDRLYGCLSDMTKTYTEKKDGYLLHFSSVIYEFLYILYQNYSHRLTREAMEKANRNFERIEEVLQYVKSNYKGSISLNDVAGVLNLSPEYFCRMFKKHTGQTFLEYLNAIRLIHFHQELLNTDYSVTDLMERNGITNYKVFIRTFKETYGTTPAKLRMG